MFTVGVKQQYNNNTLQVNKKYKDCTPFLKGGQTVLHVQKENRLSFAWLLFKENICLKQGKIAKTQEY